MPNRIIKESICRSESIDSLSWFEEVLFYRLIVVCDDYGRFDGRPAIIKGSCFPLKDDITKKHISEAIERLSTAGLIRGYEVQGRPFLQLTTWDCHQQIRAKKSKFPSPDETCNQLISNDINGNQEISSECKCPRNPIQSESNPKRNPNPKENMRAKAQALQFNEFWTVYPLKKNMLKTRGEYSFVLETTVDLTEDMLISACKNYAEACKINKVSEKYIKYPDNWLRESVWIDYLPGKYQRPERKEAGNVRDHNNFERRNYDYEDIENQLLNADRKV